MFTGLVAGTGRILETTAEGLARRLRIVSSECFCDQVHVGDSVAINGCCLTVVRFADGACDFQAGDETLRRTNLGQLELGDRVNLELSLRVGDRMGGHFVTGHVDGVGHVTRRTDVDDWSTFWFEVPSELARHLAPKGCIAVDGVSLTVVDVAHAEFSVALIPHTLAHTTLGERQVGSPVNIETDLLAKYLEVRDAWVPPTSSR